MYEDLVSEYFNELLKKTFTDVMWMIFGIFIILILVLGVDFYCRWIEIGRKYGI